MKGEREFYQPRKLGTSIKQSTIQELAKLPLQECHRQVQGEAVSTCKIHETWDGNKLCNGTSLLENFGTSLAWNVSWNFINVLEHVSQALFAACNQNINFNSSF